MSMGELAYALVSEAEFLALPESVTKVELLDGEVIVSPSPTFWHQEVLGRAYAALRTWARDRHATVAVCPLDIRFAPNRILQPDIAIFLEKVRAAEPMPINRVPEICVEVVSRDRLYDRVTKRFVYAAAGVRELWLVQPANLIERFSGDGLEAREEIRDVMRSPLLENLALDVPSLFAGLE
jgi:Uma2 family endonuclease